jgi:hypothetical protein
VRKSASGADILIHMRYAISEKPNKYTTFNGDTYVSNEYYNSLANSEKTNLISVDWREVIY